MEETFAPSQPEKTTFEKLAEDLDAAKENSETDGILRKHLTIGFAECSEALAKFILERGEECLEDMINLAPYGDYNALTEDKEVMLKFLQEEAIKPENWVIQMVEVKKKGDQLIELLFFNKSVDDGDILKGFVFVGASGKIRHAFVQAHS